MANPASIPIRTADNTKIDFEPNLDPSKGAKQDTANTALAAILAKATAAAVVDDEGTAFNPDSLPQTLGYVDGVLTTVTAIDGDDSWVQTFTYSGGNLTGVSAWVKQ